MATDMAYASESISAGTLGWFTKTTYSNVANWKMMASSLIYSTWNGDFLCVQPLPEGILPNFLGNDTDTP